MEAKAVLKMAGNGLTIELIIPASTSYWFVAMSERMRSAEYVLSRRFFDIKCEFCQDMSVFFADGKQHSIVFAGKILDGALKERVKAGMEASVKYLCNKLELELVKVDFECR